MEPPGARCFVVLFALVLLSGCMGPPRNYRISGTEPASATACTINERSTPVGFLRAREFGVEYFQFSANLRMELLAVDGQSLGLVRKMTPNPSNLRELVSAPVAVEAGRRNLRFGMTGELRPDRGRADDTRSLRYAALFECAVELVAGHDYVIETTWAGMDLLRQGVVVTIRDHTAGSVLVAPTPVPVSRAE